MAYEFNIAAAINQIATIEAAIATPSPGITNAYGFGLSPASFDDPADLPAIVHFSTGPEGPTGDAEINVRQWQYHINIYSRLLVIESLPDKYPADEAIAAVFWKAIADAFGSHDARNTLVQAGGNSTTHYLLQFPANSYAVRPWPPVQSAPQKYWSLQYVHRFTFWGG